MSERAPTDEQLAAEDQRRSDVTVQDLLDMDLADPDTPSRRVKPPVAGVSGHDTVSGSEPAGFDLPLRDWHDPEAAG